MNNQQIITFQQYLLAWYGAHGRRDLPWRNTSDPYHIWLSETMLQQTQVATVKSRFYAPFIKRFPSIQNVAQAELEEVLTLWQGLGYYRRAAHFHSSARSLAPHYLLPSEVEVLLALPGIGRNTAHAIAAFGFHKPHAVMEANVKRVLCRIFAYENPTPAELWLAADVLLNKSEPFNHNQAMMDLGAMLCTPRLPACSLCPANIVCQGQNQPERFPLNRATKPIPIRHKNIVILQDAAGKIHASPRMTKFLTGLYHFCELEADAHTLEYKGEYYALSEAEEMGQIEQKYSHFTLQAKIWLLTLPLIKRGSNWRSLEHMQTIPISGAEKKILSLLEHYKYGAKDCILA